MLQNKSFFKLEKNQINESVLFATIHAEFPKIQFKNILSLFWIKKDRFLFFSIKFENQADSFRKNTLEKLKIFDLI